MALQWVLAGITLVAVLVITLIAYNKRKFAHKEVTKEDKLTMERLLEKVKIMLVDMLKDDNIFGKDGEEWERAYARQKRVQKAMRDCVYGIEKEKIVVKDLIKGCIQELLPDDEKVDMVLDLNNPFIDPMIKWEIMAYYWENSRISVRTLSSICFINMGWMRRSTLLRTTKHPITNGRRRNWKQCIVQKSRMRFLIWTSSKSCQLCCTRDTRDSVVSTHYVT